MQVCFVTRSGSIEEIDLTTCWQVLTVMNVIIIKCTNVSTLWRFSHLIQSKLTISVAVHEILLLSASIIKHVSHEIAVDFPLSKGCTASFKVPRVLAYYCVSTSWHPGFPRSRRCQSWVPSDLELQGTALLDNNLTIPIHHCILVVGSHLHFENEKTTLLVHRRDVSEILESIQNHGPAYLI